MRHLLFACLASLLLSGCAATQSLQPVKAMNTRLTGQEVAAVTVNDASKGGNKALVRSLAREIKTELLRRGIFRQMEQNPQSADLLLEVTITEANDIGQGARLMLGAFAGQASLKTDVKIIQRRSGQTLGEVKAEASSSGGHIFAGTTDDAQHFIATQIADYLMQAR